jgi:hypothetical protein
MFTTFLFLNSGYSFPRILLNYVDSLENTKYFNWSSVVANFILFKMRDMSRKLESMDEGGSLESLGYLNGCVVCLYISVLHTIKKACCEMYDYVTHQIGFS